MKPSNSAHPTRTRADRVYLALRDLILNGGLEPGTFAREQDLSDRLGVSRTPVREALGRLASEGFLEKLPHRGFRVPKESFGAVLDQYPIISALELLAGRLAFPRVQPTDIASLRKVNERLRAALGEGDTERAIELNDGFHAYIAELAGNARLRDLLHELHRPLRRLETWYYSDAARAARSVDEHDALIRALETGELERALAIFERNMALTTSALLSERAALRADE